MGSKGSNTTTETKNFTADPRVTQWGNYLMQQGQNLPGQGDVPLLGTEGFSPDQLAAFQGVRQAQGTYNPYAQRAEALNAEYGRGLDFERVGDYYNQLSKGPLEQLWNQQRAQMAQGTRNAVQAAGGTGASRIGVAQGNIANQQNLATGALQSNLLGQSVGAFQNDLAMKGAAAAQEANLGMGHTAQNYNDFGQLYGIGSAQQGLGQTKLNNLYQQAQMMYQNPYLNYQFQTGLLPGLSNAFKGTETTTKEVPEASPWGTLLGAAGAGLGTYFGGPAGGAALGSLFGKGGGGYGNSRGDWNPNVPGGRMGMAAGGAVSPFGGGQRSGLFDQMVKEYFPKNNPMTNQAGIKAGNPFGQMVPGQQAFADGGEVDDFDTRFGDIPAPDLYDPGVAANRNALRDAGYNSPYRTEPMSEGDDMAPPLPQARPPFEMFPNRNPLTRPDSEERLAFADGSGESIPAGGGRQLPPMPDTNFQAPQRNPWGAVINAAAAALGKHGERTPSGHLMSGTVFGQAARAAGAGLDAGMKTHAAGREEDRRNYEMKLRGESLSNQAAMQRLPYMEMTAAQREQARQAARPYEEMTAAERARNQLAWEQFDRPYSDLTAAQREELRLKENQQSLERDKFERPYERMTVKERAELDRGLWQYLGPTPDGKASVFQNTRAPNEAPIVRQVDQPIGHKMAPRPIPSGLQTKLGEQAKAYHQTYNLAATFGEDKVAKTPFKWEGNLENWIGKHLNSADPRLVEMGKWWQDYQAYKAAVRKELYGSALTHYEIREWEKQDINPAMRADVIKHNIERQKQIIQDGLRRHGRSLVKQRVPQDALEELYGFELGDPTKAATPAIDPQQVEAAREWIKANPDDPRVPAIKKKLGIP